MVVDIRELDEWFPARSPPQKIPPTFPIMASQIVLPKNKAAVATRGVQKKSSKVKTTDPFSLLAISGTIR